MTRFSEKITESNKKNRKWVYVTTPIYYVNADPHLGHAYTNICADVFARFKRLEGKNVFFLTGTDEHGQKIARTAKKTGISPSSFVDTTVKSFRRLNKKLNISNDDFIRTTQQRHITAVKAFLKQIRESNDVYKGTYKGLYCVDCERFYTEKDAVNGMCPIHNSSLEEIEEENYFFRLSKYQDTLLNQYRENPSLIRPKKRRKEILNRIKQGLDDISISRASVDWGIPLPWDEDQTVYVWVDALTNYLSGIGYPHEKFQKFWPADVHLLGKDILWFHTTIWHSLLLSAGFSLPNVFAHGWLKVEEEKMSKSLGNIVDPIAMAETYGTDVLRYYLLQNTTFGEDGSFSTKGLLQARNNDLADDLGNLLNRELIMISRYFEGRIPSPAREKEVDTEIISSLKQKKEICTSMESLAFSQALQEIWKRIREINKYINTTKPWQLAEKGKNERLSTVIYKIAEALCVLSSYLYPFIPTTAKTIVKALGLDTNKIGANQWRDLIPGTSIHAHRKILFPH